MPYPRVIPHSDGAGTIDAVGSGAAAARIGERVFNYGAQSHRPFGTAAEWVTVPSEQAVGLPDKTSFEIGACLGIPGTTAHRTVFADGPVRGRSILVAGAGGAVGNIAATLAAWGGATVLPTVRSPSDIADARRLADQCQDSCRLSSFAPAESNGDEPTTASLDRHCAGRRPRPMRKTCIHSCRYGHRVKRAEAPRCSARRSGGVPARDLLSEAAHWR